MSKNRQHIKIALTNGLATSRCPLNTKLKSEDRLVELLGVSRRYLREALDELAGDGILLRRRPAGTFLLRRPAPIPESLVPGDMPLQLQKILPELLLEEEKPQESVETVTALAASSDHLKMQFWGVNPWFGPAQHLYQLGMMQAAMRLGVNLTFHALETDGGVLTVNEINARMQANPAAIYIIPIDWRENFGDFFDSLATPILYMDSGAMMNSELPHVGIDNVDMVERALNVFAESGLKRIAMAAAHRERTTSDWYEQTLSRRYRNFMAVNHLDRGYLVFCKTQLNDVVESVRAMLHDYQPEAIYVNDDFLMAGIAMELKQQGLVPGRDIAVISISNLELPLPADYEWTSLQNNLKELGEQAVVQAAMYARGVIAALPTVRLSPRWKWGKTHMVGNATGCKTAAEVGLKL